MFVELTPSIHQPLPSLNGRTPLQEILSTISTTITELAISVPNTGLGLYFFHSKVTSEKCEPGLYQYFKLKPIDAAAMKQIQDDLEDGNLAKKYQPSDEPYPSISSVLLQTKKEYVFNARNAKRFSNKRVFLITNNDKPFDPTLGSQTRKSLRILLGDLADFQINVVPFFLDGKTPFDTSIYSEIFFLKLEDDDLDLTEAPPLTSFAIQDIQSRVETRKEVKRVNFSCELHISKDLVIEVKGFSFFSKTEPRKSIDVYTGGEVPRTVLKRSSYMTKDLSKTAQDTNKDLIRAYQLGSEVIFLSDEQLEQIRHFDGRPDGLEIIGFKDIPESFDYGKSVSTCPFVYVNTRGKYINTFRVFSALFQSCRRLSRAALVWGSTRSNAFPSLYALVPSEYEGIKPPEYTPQGFFLIALPFVDAIRQFPSYVEPNPTPESLVDAAEDFLKKFTLKRGYIPSNYTNASLQWHYKTLRDQALQTDVPEYVQKDPLEMSEEEMRQYLSFDDTIVRLSKLHDGLSLKQEVGGEDNRADLLRHFLEEVEKVSKREADNEMPDKSRKKVRKT